MKTKDLTQQLSGLLGQTTTNSFGFGNTPSAGPVAGNYADAIPDELDKAPIFEINYKSEQKQCIKRAKDSIMIIVKEVVPLYLQKSPLIIDKVNQDAEQLGNLYYQYKKKETYHQALMDTIAIGQTEAKRFEVCEKISTSLEDLGSRITELQNQLRKYYIDTYLDMQSKDDADGLHNASNVITNGDATPAAIQNNTNPDLANVITGTEETVKILAERKKQALLAKYKEAKENSDN